MQVTRDSLPTLRDVLASLDSQPDQWLFMPADEPWSLDSPCIPLDTHDLDDDEELPPLAKQLNLQCALLVSDLRGIRHNATAQLGSVTDEQLFGAFMYYYDNDAYKDFGHLYDPPPHP